MNQNNTEIITVRINPDQLMYLKMEAGKFDTSPDAIVRWAINLAISMQESGGKKEGS
jgi:hypothetical protein